MASSQTWIQRQERRLLATHRTIDFQTRQYEQALQPQVASWFYPAAPSYVQNYNIFLQSIIVCYWHKYLDLLCLHKCILSNDTNVSIGAPIRNTRNVDPDDSILLNVPKCRKLSNTAQCISSTVQYLTNT